MAELVDVVLDAPVDPGLSHEVGANLGRDDLVRPAARPVRDDRTVEVDDHAFAHGIEGAVRSAHADIAVTMRLQKLFDWLVKRHESRIGAV